MAPLCLWSGWIGMALSFCLSANVFQRYLRIVSLDFLNDCVPFMSSWAVKFYYLVIFCGCCSSNLSKPSLISILQPLSWWPYLFLYMAVDSEYQNYKNLYLVSHEDLLLLFFTILLDISPLLTRSFSYSLIFNFWNFCKWDLVVDNFFIMSWLGFLSSLFWRDGVLGVYFTIASFFNAHVLLTTINIHHSYCYLL